jgi:hypothetical protein
VKNGLKSVTKSVTKFAVFEIVILSHLEMGEKRAKKGEKCDIL